MSGPHKHLPIDESAMLYMSPKHTICQMLRDIYWLSQDNDDVKIKARIAMSMAKSMDAKLSEYNQLWDKDFWDKDSHFKETIKKIGKKRDRQ